MQNLILDCCTSKIYGTALIGEGRMQTCTYNSSSKSSSSVFVKCIPDLEDGPSYSSLNLTSCQAKYNITGELGKLKQVRITSPITNYNLVLKG